MNSQTTLPISALDPSPHNVRKTGGTSIKELAGNIAAVGLLHNLVVRSGAGGRFEVVDGHRRLAALKQLIASKHLPESYEVSCSLLASNTDDGATEASLSANTMREAMHPADQFEAFRTMIDGGRPIADIAAHFGVSDLVVKQRLRLANVSPKLLSCFREGKATLDQMIALAITDDHARQEKVWSSAKQEWQRRPDTLRAMLTEKQLPASKGVGAFVGLKDYEAAGGAVERDLFGSEVYLADPSLAERLALQKLQAIAKDIAPEAWAWVEARTSFHWEDKQKFNRATSEYKGGKETWSPAARAVAGVVVSIDANGKVEFHRGLLKPGQKQPAATGSKAAKKKVSIKAAGTLSQGQDCLLAGFRTAVLRHELATKPRVMLAALAADLASRYLDRAPNAPHVIYLDRDHRFNGQQEFRQGLDEAPATQSRKALEIEWVARLRKDVGKGDLFAWLLTQPEDVTHQLLAFVSAGLLHVSLGDGCIFTQGAGVDFKAHWSVNASWLATLQKGTIIGIVREALGATAAEPLAALKRDDAAKRAAELLPIGWLPKPLRAAVPVETKSAAPANKPAKKPAAKKATTAKKPAPAKKKPAPKKKGAKK